MFRQHTTYPQYDTSLSPDAEKGQIALLHNIEKRCNSVVLKLGRWGAKGATVDIAREYLNKLHKINLNYNHTRYALEWLVKNDVIGKRGDGETATYFSRPSTAARWAKVRVLHRGK